MTKRQKQSLNTELCYMLQFEFPAQAFLLALVINNNKKRVAAHHTTVRMPYEQGILFLHVTKIGIKVRQPLSQI